MKYTRAYQKQIISRVENSVDGRITSEVATIEQRLKTEIVPMAPKPPYDELLARAADLGDRKTPQQAVRDAIACVMYFARRPTAFDELYSTDISAVKMLVGEALERMKYHVNAEHHKPHNKPRER